MLDINKVIIDAIKENADTNVCKQNILDILNSNNIEDFDPVQYLKMYTIINGIANVTAIAGDEKTFEACMEDMSVIRQKLVLVESKFKDLNHLLLCNWSKFKLYTPSELTSILGDNIPHFRYYSGILTILELDAISTGNIRAIYDLLGDDIIQYMAEENITEANNFKDNVDQIIKQIKSSNSYKYQYKAQIVLDYTIDMLKELIDTDFKESLIRDTLEFKRKIDNNELKRDDNNMLFDIVYETILNQLNHNTSDKKLSNKIIIENTSSQYLN